MVHVTAVMVGRERIVVALGVVRMRCTVVEVADCFLERLRRMDLLDCIGEIEDSVWLLESRIPR